MQQPSEPSRSASISLSHRSGRFGDLVRALSRANRVAVWFGGAVAPWLDLWARLWLAQGFLVSGLLKAGNWDNALALARYEYPLTWLDPVTAAQLGLAIELIAPLLLILGLATRAGALALLALTLVVQVEYLPLEIHLIWVALLGWLAVQGAGPVSLDRRLARGLADSALPGGGLMVRGAAAARRLGVPVYLLVMRLWLGLTLWSLASGQGLGAEVWLIPRTLEQVPTAAAAPIALALAAGLLTRAAALALLVLLLGTAMMAPAQTLGLHALALLLLGMILAGAGRWSLDALLGALWRGRFLGRESGSDALERLPRVVVVGAGFGGLACVKALRHAPVAITLVDRHNYHLFQPLLYQVATSALAPGDIAVPIRSLLRDQANARVLLGEVSGVDTERREVRLDDRRLAYDYLVLATGASHSYFGRDEWAPFAPGLKQIEDATQVRSRLLLAFERAEATDDPDERRALLTFLIVGAGPTGVELAGAIAELARFGMEQEFRHLDPASARVLLVQSGPRILPVLPERLSEQAETALRRLGVEILTESRVESIDADGVLVSGRPIVARTVFWAAGVVASPAGRWLGAACDRSGRVQVAPDLSVPERPEVFVVGDTAASNAWDGRPVPGLGPAAKQAGRHAARVIRARVEGRTPPPPFRYRHLGSLATIGRKAAVADFGRVRLSGTPAWWLWGLVHLSFLAGARNRVSVMLDWAWGYLTFRSSTRLITAVSEAPAAAPAASSAGESRHAA